MANRYLYLARHGEAILDGVLSPVGQQQARLLGQRFAAVPLTAIHHSPLPRATQTAELIREARPDVPAFASPELGDYVPPVPDISSLSPAYVRFLDGTTASEYAEGARLATAATDRFARTADSDTHELIVTHNFLIAWFVRHALDAPAERWLGLNQGNAALTTILYRDDRPPALVSFNDQSHLPPDLRWTGFAAQLRV